MAKKIRVTLGGDRLGSGNRQKLELHNYYRSNHNLSCSRITSMSPGVLYPMYVNIGLPGDTYDFDLSAFVRTLPTEGPLFSAFKLQVDVFSADMRLYQAILHNNTTEIGFNMDQVLLPKMELTGYVRYLSDSKKYMQQHSKTSLVNYLGLSGVGTLQGITEGTLKRKFNAVPMLAYYDIFKNYYANKQEENAYVISADEIYVTTPKTSVITNMVKCDDSSNTSCTSIDVGVSYRYTAGNYLRIQGTNLTYIDNQGKVQPNIDLDYFGSAGMWEIKTILDNLLIFEHLYSGSTPCAVNTKTSEDYTSLEKRDTIKLNSFPLKNIDLMRKKLLTSWDLGEEIVIDETETLMPYNTLTGVKERTIDGVTYQVGKNYSPLQGLVVKCYQSDWFNNWLDNEYVQMIQEKSNVTITNGSFSIDALNFAKKLYDHYNRIAVTGGSYDDWMKAAYGEVRYGKAEKPIYHGGMSSEVIFDEVVSSVQSTASDGSVQPLGSLGGRGSLKGNRGGHVIVKCNEDCVIMVMVSLTPRITYTQGNAWYMTELDSLNDLHQPDFDRIGFQDLIGEQMGWWDTKYITTQGIYSRTSIGKQPAWMQYQTEVDKAFGDMAEENGFGYMILNRLYDTDDDTGRIADVTTYIDPTKYNYPFAVKSLDAQNFWTFLNLNIKVRRLMSAKQMPNV